MTAAGRGAGRRTATQVGDGAVDDELELVAAPATFTIIHDWVAYADISPAAHSLYVKIKSFVAQKTGRLEAWPGQAKLAVWMRLKGVDQIASYLRELRAIGAIDWYRRGMPARNRYRIYELPPEPYDGPLSLEEWKAKNPGRAEVFFHGYGGPRTWAEWRAAHEEQIDRIESKDAAKSKGQRERAAGSSKAGAKKAGQPGLSAVEGANAQVSPVTESIRVLDDGSQLPNVFGNLLPNTFGDMSPNTVGDSLEQEPLDPEQAELQPPPPPEPPPVEPAAAVVEADVVVVVGDPYRELEDQLVAGRPDWTRSEIQEVLAAPDVRERPLDIVRAACRIVATRRAGGRFRTRSVRGLLAPGCPVWAEALDELQPEEPAAEVPQQRGRCSDPGCVNGLVTVTKEQRNPLGGLPLRVEIAAACPVCRPKLALVGVGSG